MTVHNALDGVFQTARSQGRAALIPYLTAGHPDPATFVDVAVAVLDAGADALELGIPFSDPLLDGPSIQRSTQQALDAGVTPPACIAFAREIHSRSGKPVLFMTPYNPLLAYGLDRFARDAAGAGVVGLIVTDVPVEEQGELRDTCSRHNLHLVQLLAPTSTAERLENACAVASGFIYCISVAGVTGARTGVAATAKPLVEAVKACTDVPVAVGFGISGPEQAREVASFADGVVVGSALINVLAAANPDDRASEVAAFTRRLADALQGEPVV